MAWSSPSGFGSSLKRPLLFCATGLTLAGCATYHPAPLSPASVAASISVRTLDPELARPARARLAPNTAWDGRSWDRLSLLAFALANNPAIGEARAKALAASRSASAARLPPAATLTLTGEYANDPSASSHWLYGAASDVPLDIGGARTQRVGAADYAARAARYDYMESIWTTRMALRRALAERIFAARESEVATTLADVRTRALRAAEKRAAVGEMARGDLERVRADSAADMRKATDAAAKRVVADAMLAQALGVPISALATLDVQWPEIDASPPAAAVDLNASALLDRADILRATANYDQAEANLRGEVARQFPDIHIGPGYTWERGLVKLPFSLGLVLPPLDLNRAAIRAAEAGRAEAGAHLETVVAAALSEIDAANAERNAASAALGKIQREEAPAATLLAKQADNAFALGELDAVEWGAAKAVALQAALAQIDTQRRAQAATAALEQALRRPLEGPELAMRPNVLQDMTR
jgi:outer membrane protein TolC